MAIAGVDRNSFVTTGLAPQLVMLEAGMGRSWERPAYFWLGMVPFTAVAAFLVLMGQPFYAGVAMGLYIAAVTFIAPQAGVYALFAIQAWDPYFFDPTRYIELLGAPTPTKVLSIVIVLAYALVGRDRKQPLSATRKAVYACAAFITWGLMLAPFGPATRIALRFTAQVLVLVIVAVAAVRLIRTREQANRLMFWAIVGSATACMAFHVLGDPTSRQRGTLGEFANPNTTAMTLAVGMMAIPAAWGLTRRKWMWGVYAPVAAFIMYTLMRTGSRAACAGVVLSYSLGAIFTRGRGFIKKLAATVFATGFGVSLFFVVLNAHVLDEKSQERLESLVRTNPVAGPGFSRWIIWANGIKTFLADPFFGAGMGNASEAMAVVLHGEARDVHSNYLAVLVETGALGALLFAALMVFSGLAVWRIPQANPGVPATILFLYVLLSSLTHTTYLTKMFWLPLALAWVLCEHGRTGEASAEPAGGRSLSAAQNPL